MNAPLTNALACARCGSFGDGGFETYNACKSCIGTVLPRDVRGAPSLTTNARGVLFLFRQVGAPSLLLMLGAYAIIAGVQVFAHSQGLEDKQVENIGKLFAFIPFWATLVIMVRAHHVFQGVAAGFSDALRLASDRFLPALWTSFVMAFFTMCWTMLLVLPGVYKHFTYSLSTPVTLFEMRSGNVAVTESKRRTKPEDWTIVLIGVAVALGGGSLQFFFALLVALALVGLDPSADALPFVLWTQAFTGSFVAVVQAFSTMVFYEQTLVRRLEERTEEDEFLDAMKPSF